MSFCVDFNLYCLYINSNPNPADIDAILKSSSDLDDVVIELVLISD